MTDFCRPYFLAKLNKILWQSLLVSALSTVGLFAELTSNLSVHSSPLVLGAAAYAQEVNDTDITKYAKAVLEAEPVREAALNDIKQIMGSGQVPEIACYKKETLDNLPENGQNVVKNFCTQYESIVKKYFTSFEQFNQITKTVQSNPDLKKRIQEEMVRLQSNPNSQ